jgi:ribonuclease HII
MDAAEEYKVLVRTPDQIDRFGLSACWQGAMGMLSNFAHKLHPDVEIILDGNRFVTGHSHVRPVVKADDKFLAVSAASILAKYTQCCWMDDYHLEYPQYGFARHRGYGTAEHKANLRRLGPCPIHRKSVKPVKEALHLQQSGSKQLWE